MNKKLYDAIQRFCLLLPENKIGEYSANALDDQRLINIYRTAIENGEDVRPSDLLNSLKECHPDVALEDLRQCADTAFRHMCDIYKDED